MTQRLLSARQVQEILDVDTSTVYRMASDGRLPAVKIGKQWRFPADSIDDLLVPQRPADSVSLTLASSIASVTAHALGVMMVVTDMQGNALVPVANPCRKFELESNNPRFVAECAAEWRELAAEPDLRPRLREGQHGFECARSFIRTGTSLTGMVMIGGIAPVGVSNSDLYTLTDSERAKALETLPEVAALMSRMANACGPLNTESHMKEQL